MAGYDIGRKTLVLDLVWHDMALSPHCGLVMTWHRAHTAVQDVICTVITSQVLGYLLGTVCTIWIGLDICPLHYPRCDLSCDYLPGTWLPLKYSVYDMD